MKNNDRNKIRLKLIITIYWCASLTGADSYIAPYFLIGILGLYFCMMRVETADNVNAGKAEKIILNIIAAVLSSAVVLANYHLFLDFSTARRILKSVVKTSLLFSSGFTIFREVLLGVAHMDAIKADATQLNKKWLIIAALWGMLVLEYALVLFGARYPGILSPDSISQMTQIMEHSYSNHHPYYHTQIIHMCVAIGFKLFGDINSAVAVYSVFSILVMASCFMYVVETAYECTKNLKLSAAIFACYMFMPYHIMYSITMWKDVFFAASVTCFVVSCYRYLKFIGNAKVNVIILLVAAMGMCLLRSNGWVACFVSAAAFVVLFGKKQKKLILCFAVVLLSAYVLKHPVLEAIHVSQPATAEFLSIPLQQIARVVTDGGELTEEQTQLLDKVIDIEKIPHEYKNYISDPIKELIKEKGNQAYILEHKGDFIKLYLQLGMKYPGKYIEAWIDQTRGYWNGGYAYWRFGNAVYKNTLGIHQTVRIPIADAAVNIYLGMWGASCFLQLFLSIGLHIWGIVILAYRALIMRSREKLFITIPFLAVILTLLISTPVYSEFRYVYAVICGFPFVLAAAFADNTAEHKIDA